MEDNKKVKNAKEIEFEGIKFKSILECSCYKKLKESGFAPLYESERILLWKGFRLSKLLVFSPKKLSPGRYSKEIFKVIRTILDITYTPDFVITKNKYKIYFDVKGKENDVYPIKKKMFLKILESREDEWTYIFFEPHSVRQMVQAIIYIQEL
jgi:hypothetical protein